MSDRIMTKLKIVLDLCFCLFYNQTMLNKKENFLKAYEQDLNAGPVAFYVVSTFATTTA